ncbi:hypothetical protein ACWEJ6_39945 [Nonomuraea sp. NPDC004702]
MLYRSAQPHTLTPEDARLVAGLRLIADGLPVVSGAATGVCYAIDLGMVTQVLPDEREAGALPGLRGRDGRAGAVGRPSAGRAPAGSTFFTTGGINGTHLTL